MFNHNTDGNSSTLSAWRRDYLNGMSAKEWVNHGIRLSRMSKAGLMAQVIPPTVRQGPPTPAGSSSSRLPPENFLVSPE